MRIFCCTPGDDDDGDEIEDLLNTAAFGDVPEETEEDED